MFKQVAKGLVRSFGMVRKEEMLHSGNNSNAGRRKQFMEHVPPELQGRTIAFMRDEDENEDEGEREEQREEGQEETWDEEMDNEEGDMSGGGWPESDELESDEAGDECRELPAGGGSGGGWSRAGGSGAEWSGAGGSGPGGSGAGGSRGPRKSWKPGWVRPPKAPTSENRAVIKPTGDGLWEDIAFDGRGRRRHVNKVLGNILHLTWPGLVTKSNGREVPVMKWKHYRLSVNGQFGDAQGAVWHEFWKYFKLSVDQGNEEHAHAVFHRSAKNVVGEMMYNARVQVIHEFMMKKEGYKPRRKSEATRYGLSMTEEDFLCMESVPWITNQAAWRALCHKWGTDKFKAKSLKKIENRGTEVYHRFGGDDHICLAKHMEASTGVVPSDISVFQRGHMGRNASNQDDLCSQLASERLAKYGEEMTKIHGEGCDWRNEPIDPNAVYASGGKSHGRYKILNKLINSGEVTLPRAGSSRSAAHSSRRATSDAPEVVRLQEELRQQKER